MDLICEIVTLDDSLPQGASTSPSISNLVMARLDQRILKYCQAFNVNYTRYADDLLFSSIDFSFREKAWFTKKIKYILATYSFKLNYSKMKYGNGDLSLNGYIVSSDGIRLSRSRLSDIRRILSFCNINGNMIAEKKFNVFLLLINKIPLNHRNLLNYPFTTFFSFLQYLRGYRAFLISWLDNDEFSMTAFQKELQKVICRIEKTLERFEKC